MVEGVGAQRRRANPLDHPRLERRDGARHFEYAARQEEEELLGTPRRLVYVPHGRRSVYGFRTRAVACQEVEVRVMATGIFRAVSHADGWGGLPDYEIRGDGKIYRAVTHPEGWAGLPDYEFREDGKIYRTLHHPDGWGGLPDYEIRGDGKIYRTIHHPAGWGGLADYEYR